MSARRLSPGRLVALVEQLDELDLDLLASLRRVRVLTGRQLERLHFAGNRPADRQRRRRLARLVDLGLVVPLDRRIGGKRAGSAGTVYALGVAGQRLAAGRGPAGGRRVERPWTPSPLFLSHLLDVSELYVRLVEAARQSELELLEFAAEPACWRPLAGAGGGVTMVKPDAFVRVAAGQLEHWWFVELDRATQSPSTIERKLAVYRQYWSSGQEQAHHGLFPQVLFVVPDAQRQAVVVKVCARQPAEAWELFRVVRFDQAALVLAGREAA